MAANLEVLQEKNLSIYVEPGKLDQAGWAMDCLKRAIAWDEKRFGLKLDLDEYKIVAVGDFNSAADGSTISEPSALLARYIAAVERLWREVDGWKE